MTEVGNEARDTLANPILNYPYDLPVRHFAPSPTGPTNEGRRPSESLVPSGATVSTTVSLPRRASCLSVGRTAVKLINDYGEDGMKVYEVEAN